MVCAISKASDLPANMRSLIRGFSSRLKIIYIYMSVQLLSEHYLEFLSLKGGCTGSSEFALVIMPQCWKFHVAAHIPLLFCKKVSIYVVYL